MRTLAVVATASLLVLAMAGSAGAAPTVSLIWSSNSGGGATGGSATTAAAGDTLVLDILVNAGACNADCVTFEGLSLDIGAAGSVDTFYRAGIDSINDGSGNVLFPSASASYTGGTLTYVSSVACPLATGNFAAGFCGNQFHGVLSNGSDQGGGIIGSMAAAGINGITAPFTLAQVTFVVVPEPATGGLLALGLGALAFMGRRRA